MCQVSVAFKLDQGGDAWGLDPDTVVDRLFADDDVSWMESCVIMYVCMNCTQYNQICKIIWFAHTGIRWWWL